eukprot:4159672-Alexandrium_andersonii.AAC.1
MKVSEVARTHVAKQFPALGRYLGKVQTYAAMDADKLHVANVAEGCHQCPLLTVQRNEAQIDHYARSNERHAENTEFLSERVRRAPNNIQAVADPRVHAVYVQAGLSAEADAALRTPAVSYTHLRAHETSAHL